MSKPPNNNEFPEASWSDSPNGEEGSEILPQVKGYEIVKKLGDGGMGIVYLAEQKEPIKRQVALKIIKPGMDSAKVIARFEAERQTLASLDHPNIARVFEAGTTQLGRPYFAMEYVKGVRITEYCDLKRLNIEERLELFIQVCQAIQHAHQKGFIHRDIKPSNVLISIQDDQTIPKIIDFGVAKALSHQLTEHTMFTEEGQLVGTPEYMSPEQADLVNQDIDTCSDIYSLGVLLYELLTGTLPFDREALRKAAFGEIQRIIREEEPPRPSTMLSSLGDEATEIVQNRQTELPSLIKRLYKELEWIPLKAMRKERGHRYQSASEFADDIRNYLVGSPLIAGPESRVYQIKKYVKRNRVLVTGVVAVAFILVIGIVISTYFAVLANQARTVTQRSKEKEATQRKFAEEQAEAYRHQLYFNYITSASEAYRNGNASLLRESLLSCPKDLREWEWYHLWHISDLSSMTLQGHTDAITSVQFSRDGKRIASGSLDGSVKIWETERGSEVMTLNRGLPVSAVSFSPDGEYIVGGTLKVDNIKVWNAITGTMVKAFPEPGGKGMGVHCLSFSPDYYLVTSSGFYQPPGIITFDPNTWLIKHDYRTTHGDDITSLSISPNGEYIVTGSLDCNIKLWDAHSYEELWNLRGHQKGVFSVAFHPNGNQVASGSGDRTVKIWDVKTGDEIMTLRGHQDEVSSIAFSPDGKLIASAGKDKIIKLWDVKTGTEVKTLFGHQEGIRSIAFSPDSRLIVSGGDDKSVKLWVLDQISDSTGIVTLGDTFEIASISLSPDSKQIVAGTTNGTVKVWDSETCSNILSFRGHESSLTSISFSFNGELIIGGTVDGLVKIWDSRTGAGVMEFPGSETAVTCISSSEDCKTIVGGNLEGELKLWDMATGHEISCIKSHYGKVTSVALSKDQKLILSGAEGVIKVWDIETGSELKTLCENKKEGIIFHAVFLPYVPEMFIDSEFDWFDGGKVCWYSEHGITFWDMKENSLILFDGGGTDRELRAVSLSFLRDVPHSLIFPSIKFYWNGKIEFKDRDLHTSNIYSGAGGFTSISWSSDSKHIAMANYDRITQVWDVQTRSKVITLSGHKGGSVNCISFSPDGKRIVTGTYGPGTNYRFVTIWDAITGKEIMSIGNLGYIESLSFSPDGKFVASSESETVRLWDAETGEEVITLLGHSRLVSSVSFSSDGKLIASGSKDKTVRLWDIATGVNMITLRGHQDVVSSVAFSPDDRLIASGSADKTIRLWDIATGVNMKTLHGHGESVTSVSFSPKGKRIASGGSDGTIRLWDLQSGFEVMTLQGLDGQIVNSVSFSPDGKRIASGNGDGTVKVWDSANPEEVHTNDKENIEIDSRDAEAYFDRGKVHYSKGEYDLAILNYNKAIEINPVFHKAYVNRGLAYYYKGEFEQAILDYNEAIELNPKHEYAYINRGVAYDYTGKYDLAILDYNEAIELNPRDAYTYSSRGLVYYHKEEYDRAILDYNKAIELNPRYINAYSKRGFSYYYKGEYDLAISDCNMAIEIDPNFSEAYHVRGISYHCEGEYDRAISDYNKAIELNPSLTYLYYENRGLAYYNKDKYDQAILDYNKAIEFHPRYASAYNKRGLAYHSKGEYNLAILDYNKAIELNSRFAEAYNNRGLTYYNKREYNQAISDYNRALELNTRYAFAYYNRAIAYYHRGEYDKAKEDIHKAKSLGYNISPEFLEELGEASGKK